MTEPYFRAILEHSADAIVTTDSRGRIVEWNPAAERMMGWRRADIVGHAVEDVWLDPEERRKLQRLIDKKGQIVDYETRFKSRDGRIIEVSITLSQLKDDAGNLLGTVGITKDIRKRKKMERDLKRLAITDSLTGLYNRAHFNERVVAEVERARRLGHPLAMALMDLDGFKEFNDTKGHQAGDAALRRVGRGVLASLRRNVDAAFRYGGDEFTFLFAEMPPDEIAAAGERLRKRVEDEVGPAITASVGMSELREGDGARELVRRADVAMYKAKGAGGNRVEA